jgi:hypothetical protein
MRNIVTYVIVVILAAPLNGLAQNVSANWTTVTALQPLQKLIVELKSGKTVKGEFSSASDSGLTLIRGNKMENVDRTEIRKIYQDGGTSATKSTLIGTQSAEAEAPFLVRLPAGAMEASSVSAEPRRPAR